ncbi:MAG: DUF420 domain-containing protein [Epsilonproteobacteria bacterium]|nr:DUF420 domain-containing protein [Campylobacterota bacterium]
MFETGFFGTQAPLYMDVVTLFFALLPILLGIGIVLAVKKNYETHYRFQLTTFIVTLLMVVLFEVGVRLSGGFALYVEQANVNATFLTLYLIAHILVALLSVIGWTILIYSAVKEYRLKAPAIVKSHKKLGKLVFLGMSITSYSGVGVYYFLFVH